MDKINHRFDFGLLVPALTLSIIGLVVLFSINLKVESLLLDFSPWNQLVYVVIGLIIMLLISRVEVGQYARYSGWFYILSLIMLASVFVFDPVQGSRRWIDFGFFQYQPAEVMKLAEIIILARLFNRRGKTINKPWVFALSVLYAAAPAALVLLQPDLGTAVVFMFIWLVMISMTTISKKYLVILALIGLAILPLAYQQLEPYQQQRVTTFLNPTADPQGSGYNSVQATIAIGSGEIYGRGLSGGSQSQLNFLPEQHTDFVFAVVAEKLGFVGALLVILSLFVLIIRSIVIAWKTPDSYSMYVAVGIASLIAFHSIINLGMNLGLLPVTGIPLPLISYGGTHIMLSFIMVGILLAISTQRRGLGFTS
jgi:rod shape determining protein RodA